MRGRGATRLGGPAILGSHDGAGAATARVGRGACGPPNRPCHLLFVAYPGRSALSSPAVTSTSVVLEHHARRLAGTGTGGEPNPLQARGMLNIGGARDAGGACF